MDDTLRRIADRIERQTGDVAEVVEGLDPDAFSRRPAEGRWSVAEHLAHLCNTSAPYLDAMEASVARARRKGWTAEDARLERTWLGRRFQEFMEPPPRRRTRTFGAMKPPPAEEIDRAATLDAFRLLQARALRVLEQGDTVDLGRARIASPFVPLLRFIRFPVFEAVELMAAHADRHLWLMRETLQNDSSTLRR